MHGTEQPGHFRALCRIAAFVFRRDDRGRCNSLLHPLFKRHRHVVLRIFRSSAVLPKRIRSGTAAAMLHSWHHVKHRECLGLLLAHLAHHLVVIVDGVDR